MAVSLRTLADGTRVSALCLGAMWFGTHVDEPTSFAILDRFTERGGTLIDTADNYAYWLDGARGGESETVLGRWLAARGARDRVVLSTKVGAQPVAPGVREGLSARAIQSAVDGSLARLGTDHVDVYWAHVEDRSVPLDETLGAFADVVESGKARLLGASNHATWQVERARTMAGAAGRPGYSCVQLRYSYLAPRVCPRLPHPSHLHVTEESLDYVRSHPDLTLWAYNTLLAGAYVRADKPLQPAYDHPGTPARLAVLRHVAAELGSTPNQVVLAWLLTNPQLIPIVGVSDPGQLDELLDATDLELDDTHRAALDEADPCPAPS
ncbi:aldo/keto reductase [Labedaea rhizosphaerae]|uniref:Aryl-alcohol dehydrogenase-like predicted oxidoreductase n=1 Tax=Labedaea rhizosphaerae TaxID=598644 RepID=A0A4R6S3S6_LABRH|nr:aldo/keto reductase [Labedaea rhizosphaerae]TDP93874.1 aryl-alcohol dehydrogenase-like predicted oxidoreductase [Labedaea rhizosphaerae]